MISIRVDNELSQPVSASMSLGDLMESVFQAHGGRRLLQSVWCNGEKIVGRGLSQKLQEPLESFQHVEIRTLDREIWVRSGIDNCLEGLSKLPGSFIRVSELLREQQLESGLNLFLRCLEALEKFLENIALTRSSQSWSQHLALEIDLHKVEGELSSILSKILDLQERHAYAALGECLEYELLENIQNWKQILTRAHGIYETAHAPLGFNGSET